MDKSIMPYMYGSLAEEITNIIAPITTSTLSYSIR